MSLWHFVAATLTLLAIRSSRTDAAKALVFSPDVQQLKREQGEQAAMDYLRQLMEKAQQRLREIDPEKPARMGQKRNERGGSGSGSRSP